MSNTQELNADQKQTKCAKTDLFNGLDGLQTKILYVQIKQKFLKFSIKVQFKFQVNESTKLV